MTQKPRKACSDELAELRSLNLETRRHIHGLFEQLTEGLIILAFQFVVIISAVSAFPGLIYDHRPPEIFAWFAYVCFSVWWVVRSIYSIRRVVVASFTQDELKAGESYDRYCNARWFCWTISVLLLGTLGLTLLLWLF